MPSSTHQQNAIKMAFCWQADYGPTWCFVVFQVIQTSTAKEPYSFVILQRGIRTHCPASGSVHSVNSEYLKGNKFPNLMCCLIYRRIPRYINKSPEKSVIEIHRLLMLEEMNTSAWILRVDNHFSVPKDLILFLSKQSLQTHFILVFAVCQSTHLLKNQEMIPIYPKC